MEAAITVFLFIIHLQRNQFHDVLPGSSIEIAYEDPIKVGQCSLLNIVSSRNSRKRWPVAAKGLEGSV